MNTIDDKISLLAVVVNYKTPDLTIQTLSTLLPDMVNIDRSRVVVVDNDSGDDSRDRIAEAVEARGWSDRVDVIQTPVNGGFAYGNNYALQRYTAAAYLLLNSDTKVRPGAIVQLWKNSQTLPEYGIYAPRLEWDDGTVQLSCFANTTLLSEFLKAAQIGTISRLFRRHSIDYFGMPDTPMSPDWTTFACVIIRHEVMEEVGLLDEDYFMYFDDIDYIRRARSKGYRVYYDPSPRVAHLKGGSSTVQSSKQLRKRVPGFYYEARSRYFRKYYGKGGLWLANMFWILGRMLLTPLVLIGLKKYAGPTCRWRDNWIGALGPIPTNEKITLLGENSACLE